MGLFKDARVAGAFDRHSEGRPEQDDSSASSSTASFDVESLPLYVPPLYEPPQRPSHGNTGNTNHGQGRGKGTSNKNISYKTHFRLERIARLEIQGASTIEIGELLGITPANIQYWRKKPEYKQVMLALTKNVLSKMDEELSSKLILRKRMTEHLMPKAFNMLSELVHSAKDPKLQLSIATEILDREGTFVKTSRTNVSGNINTAITDKDHDVSSALSELTDALRDTATIISKS